MGSSLAKVSWTAFAVSTLVRLAGTEPIYRIDGRKQLFIDRRFVTQSHGVELRVNPPIKQRIVLSGTKAWEDGMIGPWGTVLADQGKYRMWYVAEPAAKPPPPSAAPSHVICYAESEDGLRWIKPSLGLQEWRGSKDNNIVLHLTPNCADVFIDPKAPATERYKLAASLEKDIVGPLPAGDGIYMYTSPDGLRWTRHPDRVFPFCPDMQNLALYDDRTGKYLAYVRLYRDEKRRVGVVQLDDIMKPWPYLKGVPPRFPGEVWAPTREVHQAFGPDKSDPDNLDFYNASVVKYPWADQAYLMFPSAFRHFANPPVGKFGNDGTLDVWLAVSRDGLDYQRVSCLPYVSLGLEGERDSKRTYMLIGMIRRHNEIYQYYDGIDLTHAGEKGLAELKGHGAIFLVKQRLDGFVSLDADCSGGGFVTPPVIFHGRRLVLNLDASATGEVQVELQDAAGHPLGSGFTFADSDPLYTNDLSRVVTWRRGDGDVSRYSGMPVRLAFRLRSAKLYSFQFTE